MSNKYHHPSNGTLHNCVSDISNIIEALKYAESDPSTGVQPAGLINVCIRQLIRSVSSINNEFGSDWEENQN